ncbi:MFS transporter [Saccharibacter sp. 17.LH.SD]|nr:MFS transporter [Saccharibacter sp. 17.LH.SD]
MASISPLVVEIKRSLAMSDQQVGLLSTIPIVLMGILSLAGGKIQHVLGTNKGIIIGLICISGGLFLRGIDGNGDSLIATAFLCGIGVALEQILIPVFIRTQFRRSSSVVMSLYSTSIMMGAALSAALASPLTQWSGWRHALSSWGWLSLIALCVWFSVPYLRIQNVQEASDNAPKSPIDGYSWRLMTIFGIGTAAYTLILAWLPTFYVRQGWPESKAGYLLATLTAIEVVAGFIVSLALGKFRDRRPLFVISTMVLAVGIITMLVLPAWYGATVVLLGLGVGALFPLSLVITADYSKNAGDMARLIGFVQGGGYIIAACMPYFGGLLHDRTGSSSGIWGVMLCFCPILFLLCRGIKQPLS